VNPSSDFHLTPTSPAINSGTATGAPGDDLESNPRPVGAGYDIGAYEVQLLECNDGNIDSGEECGEPGLGACSDPCTTCVGCTCAAAEATCGDALVCGSEQCESDGDCGGSLVCQGCACVNPPLCTSGIEFERPRLKIRATPFSLRLTAEMVIPKPWSGVNPAVEGIHMLVDSTTGSGSIDALLPGGALWKVNGAGTSWTYTDKTGAVSGITKAVVKDRSKVEDGRLRVTVQGKSASSVVLPDADSVRTTLVLGDSDECGGLEWNAAGGARPACILKAVTLNCR